MGKRKHNRNKKTSTFLAAHPHPQQHPRSHNHSESQHQHHPPRRGRHHGRRFRGSHIVSETANATNPHQNAGAHPASAHLHARPAPENAEPGYLAREQTYALRERDGRCAACHATCQWRERLVAALRCWVREMSALVEDMPLGGGRDDGGMDWRPENTVWICYVDRVEDVEPPARVVGQRWNGGLEGRGLYPVEAKGFITPPYTPENMRFARA